MFIIVVLPAPELPMIAVSFPPSMIPLELCKIVFCAEIYIKPVMTELAGLTGCLFAAETALNHCIDR